MAFRLCHLLCRTHNPDEEALSRLMIQNKRQKLDASSVEEELLLYHKLLVSGRRGRKKKKKNVLIHDSL